MKRRMMSAVIGALVSQVPATFGIDPNMGPGIFAEFTEVDGAELSRKRWIETFGEWKSVHYVHNWPPGGKK